MLPIYPWTLFLDSHIPDPLKWGMVYYGIGHSVIQRSIHTVTAGAKWCLHAALSDCTPLYSVPCSRQCLEVSTPPDLFWNQTECSF